MMMFNLEFTKKYDKQTKYLARNNFLNILDKVIQIEDVLENGSWLQPEIKKQFKIERLYDEYGNL
jgi:mRNA-degrading endonuclease RelE of RelBE toxin-antitoxin system